MRTRTRPAHEIMSDLLWFADMDPNDLSHPEAYEDVKTEARAHLAEIAAERQAWANLQELHKTCIFDQSGVRWDSGL